MKKLHSFIKHLVAILLGTALVGMSVYAVQIPTSLNNALQYIMETVWTSNGTSSGTVNVDISTGGIYIATGFLQNGNAWNNQGLAIDSSGKVVYASFSSSNPLFSLQGDFIPKLNAGGTGLEASTMYQSNGLIAVNMGATQANYTMQVHGNFKVQTPSSTPLYQYTSIGSNTGLNGMFSFPLPSGSFSCSCDTTNTGAECANTFTTTSLEGPGSSAFDYCFDYIGVNTGSLYNYNVYIMSIATGSSDTVLSTSGHNVGIGTDTPLFDLQVGGSGYALIDTGTITKLLYIMSDTQTFGLPLGGLAFGNVGLTSGDLILSTLGYGGVPDVLINPSCFFGCPKVGIGIPNPSQMLEVAGSVRANGIILSSDESLKENITPVTDALNKISGINSVYYTWKQTNPELQLINQQPSNLNPRSMDANNLFDAPISRERPEGQQIGFLAQNIEEVFPQLVVEDNNGIKGVNYIGLIPVLLESIKEQQLQIEALQAQVNAL